MLITLEQFHRWSTDNPQGGKPICRNLTRVIDFSATTLEHIEARNARIKTPELQPHLDKIGNLTILSGPENDRQANRTFEEKRPLFRETGYGINMEIAELQQWNLDSYEHRTDQLVERALKTFSLDY